MMILKQKTKIIVQLMLIFFSLPIACSGGDMNEKAVHYNKYSDVPGAVWQKLANKSIYFGHQSVGYNILEGVSTLIKENSDIPLKIEETKTPKTFQPGVLTHSRLGENTVPKSKLNGFVDLVNKDGKNDADIMFFKFCYIDFNEKTDVKALFKDYQKALAQLKQKHPKTIFIHVTAPLTTIKQGEGLKAWIKKIIGRPMEGTMENIKRHEYNEMIRAAYSGKEPLFDLAKIESTFPDGSRSTFESDGKTYYSLVPEYTSDGGHLNDMGKTTVAGHFLVTLVNLV